MAACRLSRPQPAAEERVLRAATAAASSICGSFPPVRLADQRPSSDATHSISISIAGLGSACTTQVVRAG